MKVQPEMDLLEKAADVVVSLREEEHWGSGGGNIRLVVGQAADVIEALVKDGSSLSANQCVKGGIVSGEFGHPLCPLEISLKREPND